MPAIIPKEKEEELNVEFLNNLKRKELQNLCKEHGIKAAGKNSELIEKLLQQLRINEQSQVQIITNTNTNNDNDNSKTKIPVTPRKGSEILLSIVNNTPNSTFKSIVESVRKTGLNSSPIRIPYALSPMSRIGGLSNNTNIFNDEKLQLKTQSPLKFIAKEPSKQIKKAFIEDFDSESESETESESEFSIVNGLKLNQEQRNENNISLNQEQRNENNISLNQEQRNENNISLNEEIITLPIDNKRPHEDLIDALSLEKSNEDSFQQFHRSKKEKLEDNTDEIDDSSSYGNFADTNLNELKNDDESGVERERFDGNNIHTLHSHSFNFTYNSNSNSSSSSSNISTSELTLSALTPTTTTYSTDLLTNFKDPELKSPELLSAIDTRTSRSEAHDYKVPLVNSSSIPVLKRSTSVASNPLLPSGIIKLLEKKRMERMDKMEQMDPIDKMDKMDREGSSFTNNNASANFNNNTESNASNGNSKKKFDLKESLKRPLPYKPHIGSMNQSKKGI